MSDIEGLLVCLKCKKKLLLDNNELTCPQCQISYPIINNIPRMLPPELGTSEVSQVKNCFSFKWKKQSWWGIEGSTHDFFEKWLFRKYGWENRENYLNYFKNKKLILDAGCGSGRETIRMAQANPEALVIGMDISEAVDEAMERVKKIGLKNVYLVQGDINQPPFPQETFDFILSEGVLHHTPDTKKALFSLIDLLQKGGEIGFYVYRKKSIIREFTDDYIRSIVSNMNPEEAWQVLMPITKLGKVLDEIDINIKVEEDISILGIKAGEYKLQRFIYYNILKCFWNPSFSFEENNHVNFDWYYPKYAWRHSLEEIEEWLAERNLTSIHKYVEDSGITIIAKK